ATLSLNLECPLRIGAGTTEKDARFLFHGQLAEVRLWDHARSQADIQADMPRRMAGNEPGLIAYWPLDGKDSAIAENLANPDSSGTIHGATTVVADDLELEKAPTVPAVSKVSDEQSEASGAGETTDDSSTGDDTGTDTAFATTDQAETTDSSDDATDGDTGTDTASATTDQAETTDSSDDATGGDTGTDAASATTDQAEASDSSDETNDDTDSSSIATSPGKPLGSIIYIKMDGSGKISSKSKRKKRKKRKKQTFSSYEKYVRKVAERQHEAASTYLKRHKRSNRKKKNGWLKDFAKNCSKSLAKFYK
ncbi:MAG: hypothetical protein AAGD25_37810, partial [Cyanobacteria bacterium P01_F01_bin.150]